ncbi:putative clathrin assembly protein At4g40080 [Salvia miltiorrhiza]|uniref:putative clathrin assembly protein At4g40080 n=1 Tax=Salvia miltiorrhiza TaxID=226208 RepID=UPI0025AD3F2F|nr:putative clathrin assembly protein At4g40080 [Salvia miltiorrhiza]
MGRMMSLREVVGMIKDKASLSKAALLNAAPIRLAVLRATSHSPPAAPDDRHVSALLLSGEASRSAASPIIAALMHRLRRTGNSVVALKCLLVIHHILRRGPFILQDQLSVFPAAGGRNHLNLSDFRDAGSPAAWHLSSWVRWYARFLETLLSTSRVLGYFLCSSSSFKENQQGRISSFLNLDLIKELDSLIVLIEEICRAPDNLAAEGGEIVKEITSLFINDYLSSVNELLLRLTELSERLDSLSFGDSVELACALKRLQECRERLSVLYAVNKPSIEMMWGLVQELKDRIGMLNREGGKLLTWRTRETGSESARFEHRVFKGTDSLNFQSGRFSVNIVPSFWALDKSI